jgi:hypothetical protein
VIAGCGGKSTTPTQQTRQEQLKEHLGTSNATETLPIPPPTITLAKYEQVTNGMSYEQVEAIMGSPGTKMGESTSVDPAHNYAEYQWLQDNQGANGTFDFVGNKLIGKAQYGLH